MSSKYHKTYQIKNDFHFPCRPVYDRARNLLSRTASRCQTVDSCTHQCEQHADCKNIKDLLDRSVQKFREYQIQYRHKKHSAEQTHISKSPDIQRLQRRKSADTKHSNCRMQQRKRYRCIWLYPQFFPESDQPEKCK